MYPLSDDFMIYDYTTHHYVLTEEDVMTNLGINLAARMNNENAVSALLRQISRQVYSHIHAYTYQGCGAIKEYIIATTEKGRQVIKEAMEQQLIYVLAVGDLSRSTDPNKRVLSFDRTAELVLLETIPELGTSILYTGYLGHKIPNDVEW